MGRKRNYEQYRSPELENGSPAPDTSYDGQPTIKKRKHSGKSKHRPNEGSSEWAKKRARTIDRLLKRNQDLPANVRNDLERELAALKTTVSDKAFQRQRSAMISKYHMVRFFERKKAMRLAKQVRRKIEKSDSPVEIEELKHDLHVAEVDEAYTHHFPHTEAYISLYTNPKSEAASEEGDEAAAAKDLLRTPRPPMWTSVEEAMKEGPAALRRLRERRPQKDSPAESRTDRKPPKSKPATSMASAITRKPQQPPPPQQDIKERGSSQKKDQQQTGLNRRERRRQMHQAKQPVVQSEDESDGGGFFEED